MAKTITLTKIESFLRMGTTQTVPEACVVIWRHYTDEVMSVCLHRPRWYDFSTNTKLLCSVRPWLEGASTNTAGHALEECICLVADTFPSQGERSVTNWCCVSGCFTPNVPYTIFPIPKHLFCVTPKPTLEHALADHCRTSWGTQVILEW